MAGVAESLEFLIHVDPSQGIGAMQSFATGVDRSLSTVESRLSRFSSSALKIGAAGIGAGGLLTELGSGLQESTQQLDAAITATGHSVSEYEDRISEAQATEEGFAHTHEETDRALQTLVSAYGDTEKALDRLQLVTDIAAARHISLAAAADIVARAHGGSAKAFKLFGIQVQQNADGTKDYEGALDQLSTRLQGQAAASVDSLAGRFRVLGTEVKDAVASFGRDFGPAILGVSTALTAVAGITQGLTAWNDRLKASQKAAALAAEEQAAAEADAVAAERALQTNSAASVATLYEQSAAQKMATDSGKGLSGALAGVGAALGPLAIGAGIGFGILKLGEALGLVHDRFANFDQDLQTADAALQNLNTDANKFNPQTLVGDLTEIVKGSDQFAQALVDADTNASTFAMHLLAGGRNFADYADQLAHGKNVTDDDRAALQLLTQKIEDHAEQALKSAVANGQLNQSMVDGSAKVNKLADGGTNWVAVLNDMASKGLIAKAVVDDVAAAAQQDIKTDRLQNLAKWYDAIRQNAEKAEEAALKLAPADIRVQRGALSVSEDQQRVIDAQNKIEWDRRSGASSDQLAEDERALESARLDLEQATLDQAEAETELAKTRADAAGKPLDQKAADDIYLASLAELNSKLTGPTHDAINQYIWDTTIAINKTRELAEAQTQYHGLIAQGSEQPFGGGGVTHRATGGPVGMEPVVVGERRAEVFDPMRRWIYPSVGEYLRGQGQQAQQPAGFTYAPQNHYYGVTSVDQEQENEFRRARKYAMLAGY